MFLETKALELAFATDSFDDSSQDGFNDVLDADQNASNPPGDSPILLMSRSLRHRTETSAADIAIPTASQSFQKHVESESQKQSKTEDPIKLSLSAADTYAIEQILKLDDIDSDFLKDSQNAADIQFEGLLPTQKSPTSRSKMTLLMHLLFRTKSLCRSRIQCL
eukprot:jgi/Hompol1/4682/HPOL_001798-RA